MSYDTKRWEKALGECGNEKFLNVLLEMIEVHNRKSHDYASKEDPLQNVRTAQEYDIPTWIGVQIRLDDKRNRIKGAIKKIIKGQEVVMANESLRDSFSDRCVYSVIALILLDEWLEEQKAIETDE